MNLRYWTLISIFMLPLLSYFTSMQVFCTTSFSDPIIRAQSPLVHQRRRTAGMDSIKPTIAHQADSAHEFTLSPSSQTTTDTYYYVLSRAVQCAVIEITLHWITPAPAACSYWVYLVDGIIIALETALLVLHKAFMLCGNALWSTGIVWRISLILRFNIPNLTQPKLI